MTGASFDLLNFRLHAGEGPTAILAALWSPSAVAIDPTRTGTDPWASRLLRAPPGLRCKQSRIDIFKWVSLRTYFVLATPFLGRNTLEQNTDTERKETNSRWACSFVNRKRRIPCNGLIACMPCGVLSAVRHFLLFCFEGYFIAIKYFVSNRPCHIC